ncbi:UNVERIFIED_ORG: hypothetical protein ABIB13_002557 [Arthrobacter sp. UYEF2]
MTSDRASTGPGNRPKQPGPQYAPMNSLTKPANKILHQDEPRRKTAS